MYLFWLTISVVLAITIVLILLVIQSVTIVVVVVVSMSVLGIVASWVAKVISTRTMVGVALTVVNVVVFIALFLLVVASMMLSIALLFVMSFVVALFFLLLSFEVVVIICKIVHIVNVSAGIAVNVLLLPCWDTLLECHKELVITEPLIERGWNMVSSH